ncbi:hypothetical protein DS745_17455 [Anaerobacillus alkaliphilus]|uniref:Cytosolic protein n=1 Tax=Anaerobacillus alkaliphilus TaxID=1548597 RepID=A0A4Q0VP42_9BACI|nr:spore coat protein YlbD [Anaerobacillus alkaliphilus]RXI98133.1 hypothetical protein DS745_17455 [Anaerobacillus alkaliphilus]
MSKRTTLHPSVQQFKQFVKKHPLLIKEVRAGKKSWQDFYEEWTILGDNEEVWKKYKKIEASDIDEEEEVESTDEKEEKDQGESKGPQFGEILSMLKSINLNDIQGHVQNLSGIMATVQGLLQSFQSNPSNQSGSNSQQTQQSQPQQNQQSPFNFRQF